MSLSTTAKNEAARGLPWVEVAGPPALVDLFHAPLDIALGDRSTFYRVEIDPVGRCGEVLIAITSRRGRVPLLFATDELDAGYVRSVVSSTVERYGL
jgi:hypothetical protein